MIISAILILTIIIEFLITKLIFKQNKKYESIFLILSFMTIFIFLQFRTKNTEDLNNYKMYFDYITNHPFNEVIGCWNLELFYVLINYIIGLFTKDFTVFLAIIDILCLIGPFLLIKNETNNKLLGVITYLIIGTLHVNNFALRQALSISIVTGGFYFVKNKKIIKYICTVLVAVLFHKTSIISLLIYPIFNYIPNRHKKIIWLSLFIFLFVFGGVILNLLTTVFGKYDENSVHMVKNTGYGALIFYTAINGLYWLIIIKERKNKKNCLIDDKLLSISMLCLATQILATKAAILCRLTLYFVNIYIIILSNIYNTAAYFKEKIRIGIILAIILISYYTLAKPLNQLKIENIGYNIIRETHLRTKQPYISQFYKKSYNDSFIKTLSTTTIQ